MSGASLNAGNTDVAERDTHTQTLPMFPVVGTSKLGVSRL